tara:strand:- start:33 stop:1175 length:1143 start_codon:yes stop_codon:yes gene_type:complete
MVDQKIETYNILDFQKDIWERIRKISTSNKVGSAYLFYGPPGCGKEATAIKFSQMLNCEISKGDICGDCPSCMRAGKLQHENIKLIFPMPTPKKNAEDTYQGIDKKSLDFITQQIQEKSMNLFHKIRIPMANRILIQSIRELRKSLYLKGDSRGRKVVLVFDAHLLSVGQGEAANAFLKLLEEPPSKTTIVLVTDHIELLLPTIISRCQRIGFPCLENPNITSWFQSKLVQERDIPFLVGLSRGNLHNAQFFISQSKVELEDLIKNLVETTTNDNPEKWRKFIQDYSRLSKQKRDDFEYHFMLLRIWYQSVNRLKNNLNDPLHDTSLIHGMKKFINAHPFAELLSIVSDLEDTVRAISMNLYMPLVLTNLLLETQNNLKQ